LFTYHEYITPIHENASKTLGAGKRIMINWIIHMGTLPPYRLGQKEHTKKDDSRNDDPDRVLPPRCGDFEEGIAQQPCQREMSVFNTLKILDYD
jgi:hypothetical protein